MANILLVDDEEIITMTVGEILRQNGHSVVTATNGSEGLNLLIKDADGYDIVIADLQMPGLDGRDLTFAIRAAPKLAKLPVILVSGMCSEEDLADLMKNPLTSFLPKPVKFDALLELIDGNLAKKNTAES